MPNIARAGVDTIATGHACDGTAGIAIGGSSPKVFINGARAALQGTSIVSHTILVGEVCVAHSAVVNTGSSKVFCGGIPISRLGDSADLGAINSASSNVSAGG
jgi:uncharacterized Zn-binding protein involved in type VI secretion